MTNKTNPNHPANPNSTEGYTAADQLPGGCEACDGTGHTPEPMRSSCTGWVSVPRPLVTCPVCHGTGDPQ